ncbi:ATP-binding protein [Haliscomenobacter sp.]|uniref:ATP-binding protein n=1 Tax=Haliscomenobacter sp. TaxID=2717303 RepID=UPI003BABD767
MRNLIFCLLLFPFLAFTQNDAIFRIDSLPKEGVLLNQGWKWHAGDHPDWAKVDFDDSQWESIDPTRDIFELPRLDKSGEIFWLRLHLAMDPKGRQPLAMLIQQSGASEIYLDGRLVHKIGVIEALYHRHQALNPMQFPYSFPTSKTNSTLAIRYAFKPNTPYSTLFGMTNPVFSAKLNLAEIAFAESASNLALTTNRDMFRIGVYFVLFIIFFTRFLFLPTKKVSLYFSIYTFLYAISWWQFLETRCPNIPEKFYWANLFSLIIQTIGVLFLTSAVYQFFDQKRTWMYWILVSLAIVSIPFAIVFYGWGWLVYAFIFYNFANFEIVRTSVITNLNKQKGAWIMVVAGGIYLICWIVFTLLFSRIVQLQNRNIELILFDVSMLIMSLAFAINLGFDFAMNYRSLQQQFEENQKLAEENQAILTVQNETLERQVEQRTAELKASQAQLIQSEKLASLGELTAGIAHEIQNPLNFVNNFAEVSAEMLDEMQEELEKGDTTEAIAIATDLKTNLKKINHHGQRASAIVKGMLEHSRASTGVKEPTDLNALADEYLRLAYHGLRAKDNNFNATLETHFDPNLPKVSVIPQDIGRVLLNLINNAFYAVAERSRSTVHQRAVETLHATSLQHPTYQPTVTVSTQKTGDQVIIKVQDNGPGIPESIRDKIFQPFFTTKPTGQGTGLGLSLAYDIVTKGHGGTLNVDYTEGEGSNFILSLPILP